ncbi:MAG TPA: SBBP repeat-containing protein [Bacteroidia bacterium]|nr:SBBP repeat-containing protein [Bacteroidia bacterium]
MKKIILLSISFFASNFIYAQNFVWAKQMGGTSTDAGESIAIDATGNVYTTGYFVGIVDFDPGSGVFNLTSAGSGDIFVCKLDASGNFIWAGAMSGTDNEAGYSIAVDTGGNVYTTGFFKGTVDFDPGIGIYNLTAFGNDDIFVSKLDASGNFLWAKQLSGTNYEEGTAITVDASGNVYTTGAFYNTVDFDPSTGTYNLTSFGIDDIFVSKLDASGNFLWAKQMGGTSDDTGYGIAVDASGNVYTTGIFEDTADFNPGTGIYNMMSDFGYEIFVSKLNSSGNFIWAKQFGGIDGGGYAHSISVDAGGNVYTTGSFGGNADFDPGPGTYILNEIGMLDVYVSKLSSSGNFIWAKQMGGANTEEGFSIDFDLSGNVYTTGWFAGTVDFNPDIGTYNLTSSGSDDIFVSKFSPSGNFLWAVQMGGAGSDRSISMAVDAIGNVYTTGGFSATADFDPGFGMYNLISTGGYDIFVEKIADFPTEIPDWAYNMENRILISPNPASHELLLSLSNNVKPNTTLSIYNFLGAKILTVPVTNTQTNISISTLPAGVYFINVKEGNRSVGVKKLVKI